MLPDLRLLATVALTTAALTVTACFNPDSPSVPSTGTDTADTDGVCEAGVSQPCTCEDGADGTQTCASDGSGFGECECGTADTTIDPTVDPSDPTTEPTTDPMPECEGPDDCEGMAKGECEVAVCDAGSCVVQPADAGAPCGDDAAVGCTAADSCDGKGACVPNDLPNGATCADCELGVCVCDAGACVDCDDFAAFNHFNTSRSIDGWELTGGWGLYRAAPQNRVSEAVPFPTQVFGTDGNRSAPYPGGETETSTARTRPTILPATLDFLSWHVDEGGIDTKQVRVSTDGGTSFVTIVDCNVDPSPAFCPGVGDPRSPDAWDVISLPVPADMVGEVGVVEFFYDTSDDCCSFERGWFIDATNFATECDCVDDGVCAGLGGDCGAPVCGVTGECELDAEPAGTVCGDAAANQCGAADSCDGLGFCSPNDSSNGFTDCEECAAGIGNCNACQDGTCLDCSSLPPSEFYSFDFISGWLIEDLAGTGADWTLYSDAPNSQVMGSIPTPLSFGPSFGTDGNRQAPYPGSETEHSRVTSPPDTVPDTITFSSWHVDEGGGSIDNKIIELSVDGGITWNVLVDCSTGSAQPFCINREDPRAGDEWDAIAIDTSAFAGMVGQLRITYNTGDSCCSFERGWFIDNLNFAELCLDSPFGGGGGGV